MHSSLQNAERHEKELRETIGNMETEFSNKEASLKEQLNEKDQEIKALRVQTDSSLEKVETYERQVLELENKVQRDDGER